MTLHKLGKNPENPDDNSPSVHHDDVTDKYLLQGVRVLDVEKLAQTDVPAHETVTDFPGRRSAMMQVRVSAVPLSWTVAPSGTADRTLRRTPV